MNVLPWRFKNFLSEHFPLMYHLAANAGRRGNSEDHWDRRLAETWDAADRHWPTKNELIASLTQPTQSILDIGCGNGSLLRHLQSRGYGPLWGLELSNHSIERLRRQGLEMRYGRLPDIPLGNDSFDVVIASQVLEHIVRRDRLLREMRRVLKPGGQAFVFVPDNCLGPISEPEHVIKYDAARLRAFLGRHLTVLRLESMRDVNHEIPILFAHLAKPQ